MGEGKQPCRKLTLCGCSTLGRLCPENNRGLSPAAGSPQLRPLLLRPFGLYCPGAGVNNHAVEFSGCRQAHQLVTDIFEHCCGSALQRVAPASSPSHFVAKDRTAWNGHGHFGWQQTVLPVWVQIIPGGFSRVTTIQAIGVEVTTIRAYLQHALGLQEAIITPVGRASAVLASP